MNKTQKKRGFLNNIKTYHRYFRKSNFYKFILKVVLTLLAIVAAIVLVVLTFRYFNIDLVDYFYAFANNVPDYMVWIVFFISECTLGLIPPDLFMIWGTKFEHTFLIISILASLSYIGGLIGYFVGTQIMKSKRISSYMQTKYKKIVEFLKRWGGFFVFIAALFPLPFAVAAMMAGMVRYGFTKVMLFGLARFGRFYLYALVIFEFI